VPFFQITVQDGAYVYMAEEIKKAVNIPVIGGIKITDPLLAESLVA